MSEPSGEDTSEETGGDHAAAPVSTGHPAVDEVLRSLDDLDGRPVDEHVGAFEEAHDRLRRALSDAGDEGADPTGDGEPRRED